MSDENIDLEVIQENLAELLTNTVNLTSVFYDIFLNPEPMDVNIQMFDDNNQLITVTIPNRAKDRITPYVGEGSPEGVVSAPIGTTYVDTSTSTIYYKVSGEDAYGWNAVISQSLMETFVRTYLETRGYVTTSSLHTYLVTNEYVDIPALSSYLNENGYIRSDDLDPISVNTLDDKLMIITGNTSNPLKSITIGNFISNIVSTDANNGIVRGTDSKLYVDNAIASASRLGRVRIGDGLNISASGILSTESATRAIGEVISSIIPLPEAEFHLLDGSLLSGGGSYSDFIDYITELYGSGDYSDLFETEANWQSAVTTYGVCGKFVYTAASGNDPATVRLPKITGIVEGTTDVTALGDLVEAGLPNITGSFAHPSASASSYDITNGSIHDITDSQNLSSRAGSSDYSATMDIDASRSSSIYGNSSTVQPQTIKVLYYIVVATSVKTDIEVDLDRIATDLNGKAEKDGTNITTAFSTNMIANMSDSANSYFSGLGMPSNTYTDLTLGASGSQYTAPADGYYFLAKGIADTQYIALTTPSVSSTVFASGSQVGSVYVPVRRGEICVPTYSGTGAVSAFRFVYASGSESEAS